MSGDISVSYSAVQQAQRDIAQTAEKITSQLEALDAGIQPLVSTWTGAAAEAYQAKHKDWMTAAHDLMGVLKGISQAVGDAHSTYHGTDEGIGKGWTM